jgi:hypothetical protein
MWALRGAVAGVLLSVGSAGAASNAVPYRCLFNHELLIVSHKKDNSREYIQSYIAKLKDTDVDAVMCCPTMWKMGVYPSKVDLDWTKWKPGNPPSKFPSFDHVMRYLYSGGDPVRDTLDACRANGKAFFISYRMNDHHYATDLEWPTHTAFWREHPDYWLGDTDTSPYSRADNVRLFNYLVPQVRDHFFALLEELCTGYDVDGLELDFQRFPKFFPSTRQAEGTAVMTEYLARIRAMLDRVGAGRRKRLPLCVRVPETPAKCLEAGLDVAAWDARGLVDMVNVSSFYIHSMELGLEAFRAATPRARIYGEMNYVTSQNSKVSKFARRYTTTEIYRGTALNFLARGADGLSLFNYDYVPEKLRVPMAAGLKGLTDVRFLRAASKAYVVTPGFGSLPATNAAAIDVVIPDDAAGGGFARAVLRVETRRACANLAVVARLNGKPLEPCAHADPELFPPLAQNAGYAAPETLAFFAVPLDRLVPGRNRIELAGGTGAKPPVQFVSLELGLYRR